MNHGEQQMERFVAESEDLRALESLIGRFNIFDALRIKDADLRHSISADLRVGCIFLDRRHKLVHQDTDGLTCRSRQPVVKPFRASPPREGRRRRDRLTGAVVG